MTTIRSDLQKKAQGDLIQYAIFRWESALLIAVTILLTFLYRKPFGWWPPFGWALLGLIGLAAIIYTSLTDAETNAKVLLSAFQDQFNPRQIKHSDLRKEVENALEYQRRIELQIRKQREGVMRDRLEDTAGQITDWISNVYQLALRIDSYRRDDLLERERESVPREIDRLMDQRKSEHDFVIQQQLDEVIDSKGQQLQTLRALDSRMKQAELQLDQSVTALGTIYSQIQLIDAQDVGSGRAERLQSDIQEQVHRLNDLVSSISEVYSYSG